MRRVREHHTIDGQVARRRRLFLKRARAGTHASARQHLCWECVSRPVRRERSIKNPFCRRYYLLFAQYPAISPVYIHPSLAVCLFMTSQPFIPLHNRPQRIAHVWFSSFLYLLLLKEETQVRYLLEKALLPVDLLLQLKGPAPEHVGSLLGSSAGVHARALCYVFGISR